jgi:hypothetical protein
MNIKNIDKIENSDTIQNIDNLFKNINHLEYINDISGVKTFTNNINNKNNSIQFKNTVDLLTFEYFSKQKSYNKYLKTSSQKDNENKLTLINKHDKKFYKKRIINETKKILKDCFNKYIFSLINYFKFQDKIDILQDEYKELNINRDIYTITEGNTEMCDDITNDINIDNIDYTDEINELLYNFNKKELNKKVTLDNFIITNNKKQHDKQIIPLQKNIDLREPSLKTKGLKYKNKKKEIITNNIEINEINKEKNNTTSFETIKNEEI